MATLDDLNQVIATVGADVRRIADDVTAIIAKLGTLPSPDVQQQVDLLKGVATGLEEAAGKMEAATSGP